MNTCAKTNHETSAKWNEIHTSVLACTVSTGLTQCTQHIVIVVLIALGADSAIAPPSIGRNNNIIVEIQQRTIFPPAEIESFVWCVECEVICAIFYFLFFI